jgi:hypothetical protein
MLYFGLVELTSMLRRARLVGPGGAAERESA